MWKLGDAALGANAEAEIGPRPVTNEPMSIIANLGLSTSFTTISKDLVYPATMRIDYVRVYQPKGETNIGCSPPLFVSAYTMRMRRPPLTPFPQPTANYIGMGLASFNDSTSLNIFLFTANNLAAYSNPKSVSPTQLEPPLTDLLLQPHHLRPISDLRQRYRHFVPQESAHRHLLDVYLHPAHASTIYPWWPACSSRNHRHYMTRRENCLLVEYQHAEEWDKIIADASPPQVRGSGGCAGKSSPPRASRSTSASSQASLLL